MDEHRRARLTYGPMAPPPPRNPLATFAFVRTVIIILPRLSKFQTATLHHSSATIGQVPTDTGLPGSTSKHDRLSCTYFAVPQHCVATRLIWKRQRRIFRPWSPPIVVACVAVQSCFFLPSKTHRCLIYIS